MDGIATTLASLSSLAFQWSALAFILINGLAIGAVLVTRDRSLVNRWTAKLLFADLLLVGTGVGIPVVARAARLVVEAVAATAPADGSAARQADARVDR
jgi:hypothetical protein